MAHRRLRDMFKSIFIFVLAVYGIYATIRNLELKQENERLKNYLKEIFQAPEPDSNRIYQTESKRDTVYLIKTKIKKEYQKDTVYVFNLVPTINDRYVSFSWTWLNFLSLRDTILLNSDSTGKTFASLFRYWRVTQPIQLFVSVYEKNPGELWWKGFVNPPEFANFVDMRVYNELPNYQWFIGAGLSFEKRIYPTLGTSVIYKKHLFDFNVSLSSIEINYKYRIK